MRTFAGLALAVVVALIATERVASRQFRAGTALVLVDVVATRLDGNLARDMTRDDFLIFEDGKPQEIRQFQGDVEQALLANEQAVPGCRAELRVE